MSKNSYVTSSSKNSAGSTTRLSSGTTVKVVSSATYANALRRSGDKISSSAQPEKNGRFITVGPKPPRKASEASK